MNVGKKSNIIYTVCVKRIKDKYERKCCMKLNQLTQDSKMQLEITSGKDRVYIDVSIAQVAQSGLVLNPVTYEGKVVSFKNNQDMVNIIWLQDDGKPQIWKRVGIDNAIINKKPYVLVRSKDNSMDYNRRTSFRLPLDVKGSIIGYGEVVIHDISSGGIGFYMDTSKEVKIGQQMHLGFSVRGDNYSVTATVVRIVPEERRTLYGCTMPSSPMIDTFITEEQRLRIKGF